MSKDESKPQYFTDAMKKSLVGDFVVQFYNRSLKLDLAERSKGFAVEYESWKEAFEKLTDREVVSYTTASAYRAGYGQAISYTYKKRDTRFIELEEMVDKLSGAVKAPQGEKDQITEMLYSLIMVMMREGRCPPQFKLEPFRDDQVSELASQIERLTRLIDALEKRVKNIEGLRAGIHK